MTDVSIGFNDAIPVGETMHHARILHIAAISNDDSTEVPSKRGIRSDVAILANNHIPYQYGGGMNKGRWMNNGYEVLDGVAGHIESSLGRLGGEPNYMPRLRDLEKHRASGRLWRNGTDTPAESVSISPWP